MENYELVHYTHKNNLKHILSEGKLLNQHDRQHIHAQVVSGEGNKNRPCCPPDGKQYLTQPCTDACGVYFRLRHKDEKLIRPSKNQVALLFSSGLLKMHGDKWHINFCENNGFSIDDRKSYFGDEDADCDNSSRDITSGTVEQRESEVLVYDSVDMFDGYHLLRIVGSDGKPVRNVDALYKVHAFKTSGQTQRRTKRSHSRSRSHKPTITHRRGIRTYTRSSAQSKKTKSRKPITL